MALILPKYFKREQGGLLKYTNYFLCNRQVSRMLYGIFRDNYVYAKQINWGRKIDVAIRDIFNLTFEKDVDFCEIANEIFKKYGVQIELCKNEENGIIYIKKHKIWKIRSIRSI